ncbi:DUF47 family protein [Tetragenococcus koreensis]|uniref:DUF47 domain-containing protein n=1 Tax=Tetragenococcus koreensis TaxID=290335 RepID=A0AAN4RKE6_9ENTE|nr:DUF47 family protein [Tetragenococcus koreensis]MCF1584358.1 DUF47 family protein [Tetragenococcus koreensis]MCF1613907.1 DUF47 family protein [Tetragenococcus koreensis]MCF1616098.1 DUF47 family protein [Tetragenococcus koreensis]MCF1618550.1 DUF47 family protein [Tetragenococcus koreensis]MCF1621163.1 DUF47 family protein [Tetragenococcus koreensis]
MGRKKQYNYFKKMAQLAENVHVAAEILEEIVDNYSTDNFAEKAEKIHEVEKKSDHIVEELTNELYDAFITPIEREDILVVSERLDDILDGINAMTYLFENLVITEMRAETDKFAALVTKAAKGVHEAMKEFPKFKNSKTLKELISDVNEVESQGDRLYSRLKKRLFSEEQDVLEIVKWKEIYDEFELIINYNEDAVDLIDGMTIKNT